jgi:GNAT superfamily N-acetyltransferase
MSSLSICRAKHTDLDLLVPLFDAYRQFYGRPSDLPAARRFLQQRMERKESVVLLAPEAGRGVGFTQLYPSFSSAALARTFVLNDLYVDGRFRRQGVATRLLAAAEEVARTEGAVRMTLFTGVDNVHAQAVYRATGWQRDQTFIVYHQTIP